MPTSTSDSEHSPRKPKHLEHVSIRGFFDPLIRLNIIATPSDNREEKPFLRAYLKCFWCFSAIINNEFPRTFPPSISLTSLPTNIPRISEAFFDWLRNNFLSVSASQGGNVFIINIIRCTKIKPFSGRKIVLTPEKGIEKLSAQQKWNGFRFFDIWFHEDICSLSREGEKESESTTMAKGGKSYFILDLYHHENKFIFRESCVVMAERRVRKGM